MRTLVIVLTLASTCLAQLDTQDSKKTAAFVLSLYDPASGGFRVDAKSPPSVRATSGGVRSLAYLDAKKLPGIVVPNYDKTWEFLNMHYDASNGAFNEDKAKADVTITSIALLAVGEVRPKLLYRNSQEYLHANCKTFEEVRLAAAGLEAIKAKPKWLDDWIKIADGQLNNDGTSGKADGQARDTASVTAMKLRLGYPVANKTKVIAAIREGQRTDGGWGKAGAKDSDLESTYRVMRALMLLKEKPKDAKAVNAFVAKHRNADGGYTMEPGGGSTMSGTYYATAISKWLE